MSARLSRRRVLRLATLPVVGTLAVCCLATSAPARAADPYPSRPIRLVVPFAAGGSTDIVARLVAEYAAPELGQPIVVENKGGAGGALGAELVARSPNDGYTIGMATVSTHGANPAVQPNLKYDPRKDFAPITNVLAVPSVFAVNPKVPANDMKSFIALAKANPGKYSFATPGIGSLGHVNMENFMMLAGIKLLHVPYRGSAPAISDAIAGQIDAITDNLSSSLPHIQGGRLRALALLGPTRTPLLPDVPTYAELGFSRMGSGGWFGLVAPAGTDPAIIAKLNQAVHKAMANPEFRRKAEEAGGTPMTTTPAEFSRQIDETLELYAKVAKAANIKVN